MELVSGNNSKVEIVKPPILISGWDCGSRRRRRGAMAAGVGRSWNICWVGRVNFLIRSDQIQLTDNMAKSKGPKVYAVARGRVPGIYNTWSECQSQVRVPPASHRCAPSFPLSFLVGSRWMKSTTHAHGYCCAAFCSIGHNNYPLTISNQLYLSRHQVVVERYSRASKHMLKTRHSCKQILPRVHHRPLLTKAKSETNIVQIILPLNNRRKLWLLLVRWKRRFPRAMLRYK